MNYSAPTNALEDNTSPRGVGGWLFVFWLVLTFAYPVAYVWLLQKAYREHTLDVFDCIAVIPVAMAVYAGIHLWKPSPKSMPALRLFFLGWAIIGVVLAMQDAHLDSLRGVWHFVKEESLGLLYLVPYVLYFRWSVRVRNTYGENLRLFGPNSLL